MTKDCLWGASAVEPEAPQNYLPPKRAAECIYLHDTVGAAVWEYPGKFARE